MRAARPEGLAENPLQLAVEFRAGKEQLCVCIGLDAEVLVPVTKTKPLFHCLHLVTSLLGQSKAGLVLKCAFRCAVDLIGLSLQIPCDLLTLSKWLYEQPKFSVH